MILSAGLCGCADVVLFQSRLTAPNELQGCGIHAVTETGGAGAIIKDVTEMRFAFRAGDLIPGHSQAGVAVTADILLRNRSPEAGPSCARIKFSVGAE